MLDSDIVTRSDSFMATCTDPHTCVKPDGRSATLSNAKSLSFILSVACLCALVASVAMSASRWSDCSSALQGSSVLAAELKATPPRCLYVWLRSLISDFFLDSPAFEEEIFRMTFRTSANQPPPTEASCQSTASEIHRAASFRPSLSPSSS